MTARAGPSAGAPPAAPPAFDADLVVVGFGPTGATLAGLAALRGLRVVVIERDRELFALPRAVQCDHEVLRILQELGCAEEVVADAVVNEGLDFLAADRRVLLSFSVPPLAPSGWPTSVFFHQPTFERTLRRAVASLGVEVRLGVSVSALEQHDAGVDVAVSGADPLRARWVVGCDGARSATRRMIGTSLRDTGFEEEWLVVDLHLEGEVPGLPSRCLQVCDPARPHTLVPMPGGRFRFEFMLLPGESADDVLDPATVHHLLSRWIDPAMVRVERAAVYTFHGLVASTWRHRRVFLAGDAAHQTPPFLGQGMCAGMRDAANLAWKLAAVTTGGAPDRLLDTYQAERQPHAQAVIDAAVGFGRLICLTDPEAVADRDAGLAGSQAGTGAGTGGSGAAPNLIPALARGAAIGTGGGALSRQPTVGGVRLDDLVGPRFALCTAGPLDPTSPAARWWAVHGVVLDAVTHPEVAPLLDGREACAVRPDRYVLARGGVAEVTAFAASVLRAHDAPVAAGA